ncbi:MAG TPA: DUF4232 domain-containing protein [Nocardioidaceae bacterium]|nr:DUF4232 domain-containing protein [Nocardioidaceae bacterium]
MKHTRVAAGAAAATLVVGGLTASTAFASTGATPATTTPSCPTFAVSLGMQQGTAGSMVQAIRFRNTSGHRCTVSGYPGVSYANRHRIMLGWPAAPGGQRVSTVTLAAGASTTAFLQSPDPGNFAPMDCLVYRPALLRVHLGSTVSYLSWGRSECTTHFGRSFVSPVGWLS